MTTTTSAFDLDPVRLRAAEGRRDVPAPTQDEAPPALDRATADGPFSLLHDAAVDIAGEPGLVIRVRSGCLWVPNCDEGCSVGVGPDEEYQVTRAGVFTAYGSHATEVELAWPASPAAKLH